METKDEGGFRVPRAAFGGGLLETDGAGSRGLRLAGGGYVVMGADNIG